jgi:pilus assembly protein CpaF
MNEEWVRKYKEEVTDRLDLSAHLSDESLQEYIEETIFADVGHSRFTVSEIQRIVRRVYYSFRGLDAIQPLMDDPLVTEIMVNGHDDIFIERGGELSKYDGKFESREKLEDIIQTIVGKVNRMVNESSPIVDARLQDGSRVNVVLPPIALSGPTMTIRKFPEKPLLMSDLIQLGAIPEDAGNLLEKLVKAKYNVFIGGGTGSGKTTFLNALSHFVPEQERVITIEDSAELQLVGIPNLVRLETRNANTEGKGEISIRDLIRASLRMRPNRIIVGEVRGAEALDMLQALNTGHEGGISTGHANSPRDMLSRLEAMVLSGAALPLGVVRQQIASAIEIMVHLARMRDRTRKVVEICELVGLGDDGYSINPLYRWRTRGRADSGEEMGFAGDVVGKLAYTGNRLNRTDKWRLAGLEEAQFDETVGQRNPQAEGGDH